MTELQLKAKAKIIKEMGANELELFKQKVSESMLEAKPKFYLFEEIGKRELLLDRSSVVIEHSEVTLD